MLPNIPEDEDEVVCVLYVFPCLTRLEPYTGALLLELLVVAVLLTGGAMSTSVEGKVGIKWPSQGSG